MKTKIRKIGALLVALAVVFTGMPGITGDLSSDAAAYWSGVSARGTGQSTIYVGWSQLSKKNRKSIKGIAVFRDGYVVAYLGKTATGFTDSGLRAGTSHSYQLKSYKTKVKKTKMWYNKATGQYQKKKPAKKYRGKRKTFKTTVYQYKKSSYVVYASTAAPTRKFSVTWKNYDGTVLRTDSVTEGATPSYAGATPVRANDTDYGYTFSGWSPAVSAVRSNITYTAQYTKTPLYTITWVNYDNSVLGADVVKEGSTPKYTGSTPTRPDAPIAGDSEHVKRYKFKGWKNVQENVVGDPTPAACNTTYRAQYTSSTVPVNMTYTITWKNYDGTILTTTVVKEGSTPEYTGNTPVKPTDSTNTYTFSGWSPAVKAATADATYTAQFTATSYSGLIPEDESTYITLGGVKIYMGQRWTSELDSSLSSKANGTWSCTRSKGYYGEKALTTRLYNTNTYAPFVALYIVDGQVLGWNTNSDPLTVYKGQSLARGMAKSEYPSNDTHAVNLFSAGGSYGCLMMGVGFAGASYSSSAADERTVGFHFINAARVAAGKSILKRSKYLEGVDLSTGENLAWSGVATLDPNNLPNYHGEELSNIRYGAQAWAETMSASGKVAHSLLNDGPLGYNTLHPQVPDMTAEEWQTSGTGIRTEAQWQASGKKLYADGENCGMGTGENCLFKYSDSALHLAAMLKAENKCMGIGYSNGYHCEQFSTCSE